MKHIIISPFAATLTLLATLGTAHADSQTCDLVAADVVTVDGLLDDWNGIAKRPVGGKDKDVSFTVRCAYDDERLHIGVAVRDDYLYRGAKPRPRNDDHLTIEIGVGKTRDRLLVYPGNDKQDPVRQWNGKRVPAWLEVEDTQIRQGWSMEVSLPLARIRGYGKSTAALDTRIEYQDSDFAAKVEGKLAFTGQLALQGADGLYRSFLQASGLSVADIKIDKMVDVDGHKGAERVLAGRDVIGVLGDSFFFTKLPVASPGDVSKVQVVDLRGDGTHSIITEFRQHGNGGSRDLVVVWSAEGNRFQQILAFETRKQKDANVLVNRWSLSKPGAFRKLDKRAGKRGRDLVIEVSDSDATGWDEDNYFEARAQDANPILTPWSDETSRVFYFVGNSVQGGEPKPAQRRRR